MDQQSYGYPAPGRRTRRAAFLDHMDLVLPWDGWNALIEPRYPMELRGCPPMEAETMVRLYLLQGWFGLSAEALEEAVYDSSAMRRFVGVRYPDTELPDARTLALFRDFLARNGLDRRVQEDVERCLARSGQRVQPGRIADAVLLRLPSVVKGYGDRP